MTIVIAMIISTKYRRVNSSMENIIEILYGKKVTLKSYKSEKESSKKIREINIIKRIKHGEISRDVGEATPNF